MRIILRITFIALAVILIKGLLIANDLESVGVSVTIDNFNIDSNGSYDKIIINGFGRIPLPGKPELPSKIIAVAIPPGAEFAGLSYSEVDRAVVNGIYNIKPVTMSRVIGEENPAIYAERLKQYNANHDEVYESNEMYPPQAVEFVRSSAYRGYNLVDLRINPVSYNPVTGELNYIQQINIEVSYNRSAGRNIISDYTETTDEIAREIIYNYQQARAWYPSFPSDSREVFDFVIITVESAVDAVAPLVDWEAMKGRSVAVITLTDIAAEYTGYDMAAKMRNFLREKYPSSQWGIEDVLIVGNRDDVPMRETRDYIGYGYPETDFYFAELSLPDNQSWDQNGNHLYGESSDTHDYYGEVNVGRIPWTSASIVESICNKTVAYEQNSDPSYKNNILLLGAFFWNDTDNAVLMEAIMDDFGLFGWTATRMYEMGYSTYPMDYNLRNFNVVPVWSGGTYALVDWAGHGLPESSHIYYTGTEAFISSSDCPLLNDDYPAIIFADACSNSYTHSPSIGQAMLNQGAVGFLGSTEVALGCPGWSNPLSGSSQSLDYMFMTSVASGNFTLGRAHQKALQDMYMLGLWDYPAFETHEWGAIYGCPTISVAPPDILELHMQLAEDLPEFLPPYVGSSLLLQILNAAENYTESSARLHYRFSNTGAFTEIALDDMGENIYMGILTPPNCDEDVEFFFSAMTDEGNQVKLPANAPLGKFCLPIGVLETLFADNFEDDNGWTVTGTASDGFWERAVPSAGGANGDPVSDCDGSGQCYVTGNEVACDVDAGYTSLTSPAFDLSGVDHAYLDYSLWYTNDTGQNPNEDVFEVNLSNNNGLKWTLASTHGPICLNDWTAFRLDVADYILPSAHVKVKFTASDYGGGSIIEAGIDAFKLEKLVCGPTSIDNENQLPINFVLMSNYPNPFNAQTIIEYAVPYQTNVTLDIYDILGRRIETLIDGPQPAGVHSVTWNADSYSSGVYFYHLSGDNFSDAKKMVLLK